MRVKRKPGSESWKGEIGGGCGVRDERGSKAIISDSVPQVHLQKDVGSRSLAIRFLIIMRNMEWMSPSYIDIALPVQRRLTCGVHAGGKEHQQDNDIQVHDDGTRAYRLA